MIDFSCPQCGEALSVPACLAGQTETCPTCGTKCRVPKPVGPPDIPVILQPVADQETQVARQQGRSAWWYLLRIGIGFVTITGSFVAMGLGSRYGGVVAANYPILLSVIVAFGLIAVVLKIIYGLAKRHDT